ncbi:MAG: imidazole glycerol phosphate synthase subunit HisH [Acidobacteria bacterium]|nr:imidazole glycerol phosphate synthase subunit HisH [Acidobacteriota bacterium]MDA1235839.1 imidazole glycerol phosphate synthase subunit HisH [Acidobacteriota bacterium]
MIAIFDYGAGNLRSVENTLDAIGVQYEIVNDSAGLLAADKIILPGVGHFGQMLRSLDTLRVREALKERLAAGVPFLGICLGLQGLFESSAEAPELEGLGVFPGRVVRFPRTMTVPQMGWNKLQAQGAPSLLEGLGENAYVYFANSYYVPAETAGDRAAAVCDYGGISLTAAIEVDNIHAVQFHPEKSGAVGQRVVRNFLGKTC